MADSDSMAMLRRWLDGLGYNAIPWGLGRNVGPRGILMERLIATVGDLAREHRQPVSLIGHSLGGVFAREIAKVIPTQVRQVITLGSPFRQTDANGTAAGVYSSHSGMGFNPAVYYAIGDRLAQPAGMWRKFARRDLRCANTDAVDGHHSPGNGAILASLGG
jgi:triacylglycerol esterase/lipase EstA (alpha/beta hydrolase family)